MGMYDTIEILDVIEDGPLVGEYQTKDLENALISYYIKDGKLIEKMMKYEVVPEDERTHPVFGVLKQVYLGDKDTEHHGWIRIYGAKETWKVKFTDGVVMKYQFVDRIANDTDQVSGSFGNGENSQDQEKEEVAYWNGDGYVGEEDNDYEE